MGTTAVTLPSQPAGTAPAVSTSRRFARLRGRRLGAAVAIVAGAVVIGGMLSLGTWPPFATVMSASMAPTIKTGDVVLLQHLDRPARVGDIVEVNVPDQARSRYGYPTVVIHRIVSISAGGQIQTKGDARPQKDPFTVASRAVTARVVATIPAAGRVFAFLMSPMGLLWLAAGGLLLVGLPLLENRREQHERERQSVDDLYSELRTISADLAELRADARAVAALTEAVEELAHAAPAVWEPEPATSLEPVEAVEAVEAVEPEPVEAPEVPEAPKPDDRAEPAGPEPVVVRRRSGGLVGSVERHARSLSSRYR